MVKTVCSVTSKTRMRSRNCNQAPVIIKQQARIERLRIELTTEKTKLVIMKQEVAELEKNRLKRKQSMDVDVEKRLQMEIESLRRQCETLAKGDEEFYRSIYTGQQGPLTTNVPIMQTRQPNRRRLYYQGPTSLPNPEVDGPEWHCRLCTFLNHPDLDKCEQCEMPRIVHGTKAEAVNTNVNFDALRMLNSNKFDFNQAARSLSLYSVPNTSNANLNNNNDALSLNRPLGFVFDDPRQPLTLPGHGITSRLAPNRINQFIANANQSLISNKVDHRQTRR
ncbi:hypothetical protein NQ315_001943 [Exocentrus adspersus]|uniref:RanBP2-type domain-containing protein n=1 Tax=Exocentrus adspersus TaxID=1586481 RepID=A0AAV8WB12_9CUCU|nr:hypothetical protein NQ315_001943 [Exocentrus adspersus]